jgi:hypothetical protein
MNNALWIPERAVELQLRLCVMAHCRSAGHRSYIATLGSNKKYVAWTTMAKDVKVFVQNCLHCRNDSWRQRATSAGCADTCDQAQRDSAVRLPVHCIVKRQYLLLLRDDLSGYLWLMPCHTADIATTFDALMRWFFSVWCRAGMDISDRGSHFKNEVVRRVQKNSKQRIIL